MTTMVNGKKLPFSVTAEAAMPAGQVDFNFTLTFSLYATHGYCFNFMTWKWLVFIVFKVFSLLVASSLYCLCQLWTGALCRILELRNN